MTRYTVQGVIPDIELDDAMDVGPVSLLPGIDGVSFYYEGDSGEDRWSNQATDIEQALGATLALHWNLFTEPSRTDVRQLSPGRPLRRDTAVVPRVPHLEVLPESLAPEFPSSR